MLVDETGYSAFSISRSFFGYGLVIYDVNHGSVRVYRFMLL